MLELAGIHFVNFVIILIKILNLIPVRLWLVLLYINHIKSRFLRAFVFSDSAQSVVSLLSLILCVCRSKRNFRTVLIFYFLKFLHFVRCQRRWAKLLRGIRWNFILRYFAMTQGSRLTVNNLCFFLFDLLRPFVQAFDSWEKVIFIRRNWFFITCCMSSDRKSVV